jgi:hypothetical protein
MLARYTLLMPLFQAHSLALLPLSFLAMFFLKLPTLIALATYVPMVPALVTLAADLVALSEFGKEFDVKIRPHYYLQVIVGTYFYQHALSLAAIMAVYRYKTGDFGWDKTEHTGGHLSESDLVMTREESA